jgi:hypothetical protein
MEISNALDSGRHVGRLKCREDKKPFVATET